MHDLLPNVWFAPNPRDSLDLYCYHGAEKNLYTFFLSTRLYLNISSKKYNYYYGCCESEVIWKYHPPNSSLRFSTSFWEITPLKLDPFNSTCVGIAAEEDYEIQFRILWTDFWKILRLCIGVLLFWLAPGLSKNLLLYYICGVFLGICTSFLIIMYMFRNLIPKKPMTYVTLVGCGTMLLYIIRFLWENFLLDYYGYVLWYLFFTGAVSFFVCYRMGPPTDTYSKNIIKWTLQSAGLTFVYFSSEFREASSAMIVVILCIYNFPDIYIAKFKTFWKKIFPPKVRLLTEEEFHEQGVIETAKGLNNLRCYCRSPNCNQWNTVLKLRDSERFARFMEGESHLTDAEVLAWIMKMTDVACELEEENGN